MTGKMKFILTQLVFIFIIQVETGFAEKFDDDGFRFLKWRNPAPRFTELGLDMDKVRTAVSDGQLLIYHKEQEIELWSSKEKSIKKFHDVRFVSGLVVINKPHREVMDIYFDFKNYPKFMPQYTEGGIVRQEDNNFLIKLKQIYHYLAITLRTDFWYQYTIEKNGNFSILLLDGDVGAGVSRIEFIALDEGHTLVVNTSWIDIESARFTYRTVIKAVPEMKLAAAIIGVASTTDQIRTYAEKLEVNPPQDNSKIKESPEIPVYATGNIPITTMQRLSELGTLVFIHPLQWVDTENGVKSLKFVSSVVQIPCPIDKCKPVSSDFTRYDEYFRIIKGKVTNQFVEEGTETNWCFKVGVGPLKTKIDFTTFISASDWQTKNTMLFKRTSGDLDPLYGAWEWKDLGNRKTLFVYTVAMQIGDEASWVVKLANKVPNMEMTACIFVGVNIVDEQVEWIKSQSICKADID